ncbi:hypothetical protein L6164_026063 [Bauhinia variegata]|uniref:Uncharacterized protein n=1 Tax=Bauhinia variegata TaxID=167791 RepID=A0ACB9M4H5_BAUVA|nr:hypothetical protein L6164_026063 [Bauhinia variegata]
MNFVSMDVHLYFGYVVASENDGPLNVIPTSLSPVFMFAEDGWIESTLLFLCSFLSLKPCDLHANTKTDEVYAQMTLQPLSSQEQKDVYLLPTKLGTPSKQQTNYSCKKLTASDTCTHGEFSIPLRAAEKVFPPLVGYV